MTSRALPALAAAVLALALCACAPAAPNADPGPSPSDEPTFSWSVDCEPETGVTIFVDLGNLPGADDVPFHACIPADGPIAATDALAAAGVELEGTTEYGDAIVCRVNGLPAADEPVGSTEDPDYVETCESMPAGFAYWGLWVRTSLYDEWDYAQEGIDTLQLAPGESLELLFSLDGEPAAPTS
ncbi:hypothetical protein [Microbacterium sp. NPDC079995]|uniref:hypothetical protein n=1 Tax=unclassified Microbacterium TaxID=2609290 RepID=UPI003450AC58